jgi:hypothetical protein
MEFYMSAFYELSSDRHDGGMMIPWTSIDRYAERYGLTGADFDTFLDVMRKMDRHAIQKGKSKGGNGKPGAVPAKPRRAR